MIVVKHIVGIREGHLGHLLDEIFHLILLLSSGSSFIQSLQSGPSILMRQERTNRIRPGVKSRSTPVGGLVKSG